MKTCILQVFFELVRHLTNGNDYANVLTTGKDDDKIFALEGLT